MGQHAANILKRELTSRKNRLSKLALLSFAFSLVTAGIASAQGLIVEPADIIVNHGRVFTENPKQPWAQAVAIHGTKIVAVGDDTTIEKMRGMGTKVINAGGKLVLPGFKDCHIHFLKWRTHSWPRESGGRQGCFRHPKKTARDPESVRGDANGCDQTTEGTPASGFVPEQRLTVARAIDGYTMGAAFAGRREKTEGSLEVGKLADLIIISQDIFDVHPHKIGAPRVLTTIVAEG
jgi:cytosine/adenosine deaminase-related metal-dependent hydrolase